MLRSGLIVPQPADPGGAADAVFFDTGGQPSTGGALVSNVNRVSVSAFISHAATFKVGWTAPGSSNERIINGGGAGEPIAATTYFNRDVLLHPGRIRIWITTGTDPTTWEVIAEAHSDRTMGQT